ncbi:ATP-binding protein [Nocardioides euryhalodurans]|uniref:ATP-binding protein n=1 Tax=Nocardioides euryhalodurans TaxID=2518370 RepID=UPI00141E49B5|nr:BTAD domain-containing putative transcriptional regulator [Nocardioides euryhalodurans]
MAGSEEQTPGQVEIRLLGGVTATVAGDTVDLGPPKSRTLLAALALACGETLLVSRLVDLVWGEGPPRTAEKTLQTYVMQLRGALGSAAVQRSGAGYRLTVDSRCVDAVRFEERLACGDIDGAHAEWAGPPLAGLEAPGLAPQVARLTERWMEATEARVARLVETDPRDAIAVLRGLTAEHPFREELWALLMTALYRAGRQAEALSAYQTARERFVDELGVEPGPRLQQVEAMILDHDDRLRPVPAGVAPAAAPGAPPSASLPTITAPLLGRHRELAEVEKSLQSSRVVTVTGPGGIGKTHLALTVATRAETSYPDGAHLVDLSDRGPDADVARAVLDALALPEAPGRQPVETVVGALRRRQTLLVLDNCEHLANSAATTCRALTDRCPGVQILATSREPLAIGAEQLVPLPPLDPAGAGTELFAQRALAVDPHFDLAAWQGDVTEICRRLDGVPLAIELAAARSRALTPPQMLDRLQDRLRLLVGGRRDRVERHRTLRATLDWSYDLLNPAEQATFGRLSTFSAPFDLDAAERVAVDVDLDPVDVDDLVGSLVDRSLLTVTTGPRGERRYRMLETIRHYAAETLSNSGARQEAQRRHADWCLSEVQQIHQLLTGPDEVAGVERLENLWPELRTAVERALVTCHPQDVVDLVEPVAGEVLLRSRQEIGDWAERVLDASAGDPELTVFGLVWTAHRHALAQTPDAYDRLVQDHSEPEDPLVRHGRAFAHEDWEALLDLVPAAEAERRRRGQPFLAELMETDILAAYLNLGRFPELEALAPVLTQRYRTHGPPTLLNWTLMLHGYGAAFQGDHDRADRLFEDAARVEVPARTHTPTTAVSARVAFRRGDTHTAYMQLLHHVEDLLDTGNMQGVGVAAIELVRMMHLADRLDEVARLVRYLEASPLLESPYFRGLVSDAITASNPAQVAEISDDLAAAEYMVELLEAVVRSTAAPGGAARSDGDDSST